MSTSLPLLNIGLGRTLEHQSDVRRKSKPIASVIRRIAMPQHFSIASPLVCALVGTAQDMAFSQAPAQSTSRVMRVHGVGVSTHARPDSKSWWDDESPRANGVH